MRAESAEVGQGGGGVEQSDMAEIDWEEEKRARIDAVNDMKIKELGNGNGQGAQDQQALEQKRILKTL